MSADAMEMMVLSFLLPALQKEWHLTPMEDGLLGAIVFAGMFLGNIILSWISDIFGRKPVIIAANFMCAAFGLISGVLFFYLFCLFLFFLFS